MRISDWSSDVCSSDLPLLLVALYDALQRRHTLRRNYPLIARTRWLFEDLRPFLYSYIVESPFDGRPFTRAERDIVYARAKGDLDAHPDRKSTRLNSSH